MAWHEELADLEYRCRRMYSPGIISDLREYSDTHPNYKEFADYIIRIASTLDSSALSRRINYLSLRNTLSEEPNKLLALPNFPNGIRGNKIEGFIKKIYPKLDSGTGARIDYLKDILNLVTHPEFAKAYDYIVNK